MSDPVVHTVVPLGVHAVELAHARAEVAVNRFYNDMKVVVHQAVRVARPVVAGANLPQQSQPVLPISVIQKDGFAPVSARSDVK